MAKRLFIWPDAEALARAVAERFTALAKAAIAGRGAFYVALSGGRTPLRLYELLASPPYAGRIDWLRVHVYFGDERAVPWDHPDSNYYQARRTLLEHVPIPPDQVHPIRARMAYIRQDAKAYGDLLLATLPKDPKGTPRFDLILLGLGPDGHIASLFPKSCSLRLDEPPAIAVYVDRLKAWRISLSLPVLNAARHLMLLVAGEGKADAVRRVLVDQDPELPATHLHPQGLMEWHMDPQAASKLKDALVLAGDLGGTHARFALVLFAREGPEIVREEVYESRKAEGLAPLVERFITKGEVERACFAVAGPVFGDEARVTNLPWRLSARALSEALAIPRVRLINDFQAVGYGIEALEEEDFRVLQTGQPVPRAPCALIGAGTGLGEGILVWMGDHYEPLPSEGGHVDFAPRNDLEYALLKYLKARFGHVSYERVVSGPGLAHIYAFLSREGPLLSAEDPPAAIAQAGMEGRDEHAVKALETFIALYGAQAGNLALTCLAKGGVFIAGGIAPKILPALEKGSFMDNFRDKGRMAVLLENMPVKVVLNGDVGLLGAAVAARRMG